MPTSNGQFVMSTEIECLTAVEGHPEGVRGAGQRLLELLSRLAPCVCGTSGIFNAYGKAYIDVGEGPHLELAAMECDSPYVLVQAVERQLQLVSKALTQLKDEGCPLLLVGNNHDGLLTSGCAVWGAHENYMVERHPTTFGDLIMPFLVTRIYQGAGGIHYPSGRFLAGVRPIAIEQATGGGTTSQRAIHSTARDESHMGPNPGRFRYHLLLADNHRCETNLAQLFAATSLALKVALFDPELPGRLKKIRALRRPDWLALMHQCNLLAEPGRPLEVHPLVLETQRLYLELAGRYVDGLDDPHAAAHRWLADWKRTLDALEHMDRKWLSARLDAFAKYEFYSAVLEDAGCSWKDLPERPELFRELALLDQSYHEFGNPDSVFCQLERAGLLDHRLGPPVAPGDEPDPYVPETSTRARARAQFIKEHQGDRDLCMDWSCVSNVRSGQTRRLYDPFASEFEPWSANGSVRRRRERPDQSSILWLYQHGDYREAERCFDAAPEPRSSENLRFQAFVRSRLGYDDGARRLDRLYGGETTINLVTIGDYLCVWRFCGLAPDDRIAAWIERGRAFLEPDHPRLDEPPGAAAFRDHFGCRLLYEGEVEQARQILEAACGNGLRNDRVKARTLASLAAAYRRLGDRRQARAALIQAESIQQNYGYLGDLADFTFTELAKLHRQPRDAMDCLLQAESIQSSFGNLMGLARTLLLRSRLTGGQERAGQNKTRVLRFREQRPALAGCPLLAKILHQWDAWVGGETPAAENDPFWGL